MNKRTFTTAQAAKKAGISRQTLHMWITERLVETPEPMKVGLRTFLLWTERDIQVLKEFKGRLRRGPKAKEKRDE